MPLLDLTPWLCVGVAVLGILGVLSSQLLSTWRENKRAERELRHAHDVHWRDQRAEAYSGFLAAVQDWQESASKVTLTNVRQVTSPATVALRERCEMARKRARAELARIDLIGAEPVLKQGQDVYDLLRLWSMDAMDGVLPSGNTTRPSRELRTIDEAVGNLRTAIRAELGLPGEDSVPEAPDPRPHPAPDAPLEKTRPFRVQAG